MGEGEEDLEDPEDWVEEKGEKKGVCQVHTKKGPTTTKSAGRREGRRGSGRVSRGFRFVEGEREGGGSEEDGQASAGSQGLQTRGFLMMEMEKQNVSFYENYTMFFYPAHSTKTGSCKMMH